MSLGEDRGLAQSNSLVLSRIFDNVDMCLGVGMKDIERDS